MSTHIRTRIRTRTRTHIHRIPWGWAFVAALALTTSLPGQADEAIVSYSAATGMRPSGWFQDLRIPRFDPAIGTLTRVEIELTGAVQAAPLAENLDPAPRTLRVGASATIRISGTATTPAPPLLAVLTEVATERAVTAYDGVTDYGGGAVSGSGFVVDPPMSASSVQRLELRAPDDDLSGFLGSGPVGVVLSGDATPIARGANGLAARVDAKVGASVTVRYHYETITAGVAGRVWMDLNRNGVIDLDEDGIAGVPVTLYDSLGSPIPGRTGVTDAEGRYLFAGLPVADGGEDFRVGVVPPPHCTQTFDIDDGVSDVPNSPGLTWVSLTPGQYLLDVNFGYHDPEAVLLRLGSIRGRVWHDVDGDGLQDEGEGGIDGVAVTLVNADGSPSGRATAITATIDGIPGSYLFERLTPGDYRLRYEPPAGHVASPADQGDDDTKDSDAVNGVTGPYSVVWPTLQELSTAAGFYVPASLGDFVWDDANLNGVQDAGELGINGVEVALLDGDGTPTGRNTTTATVNGVSGYYVFGGLAPGAYRVRFTTPPGCVRTLANVGDSAPGADAVDSDSLEGVTGVYNLVSGARNTTADAGFYRPAPGIALTKAASAPSIAPFRPVTYAYTVQNTGGTTVKDIVVRDDNGTAGFPGDDFIVGTIASLSTGSMMTLTAQVIPVVSTATAANATNLAAGTIIVVPLPNGDIQATFVLSTDINDNTYGAGAINWGGASGGKGWTRSFSDLVDKDRLEFRFTDANGAVVLDCYIDLVSASSKFPSGYGSVGPTGDGSIKVGRATDIVSFSTSLSDSLNRPNNARLKAALTKDSPTSLSGGVVVIDPRKAPDGWETAISYTMVVKGSAFGTVGFGGVSVPDQENSPSKRVLGSVVQFTSNPKNSTVTSAATATSGTLTARALASVDIVLPPPPPPPLPTCQLLVTSKKLARNDVQVTVANTGTNDVVLSGFDLTWPITSGRLRQVKLDGDVVYEGPAVDSPASIGAGQLVSDLKKRTITRGSSDVIHLLFERDGVGDELIDYSGSFTFGGCFVALLPGCNCNLGYPFRSDGTTTNPGNPNTSLEFAESEILRSLEPESASIGDTIRVYYNDEHALLLGARKATDPASSVTPMNGANPGYARNPSVGDTSIHDPYGRPLFPALFITDITGVPDNAGHTSAEYRAGDWQFGGTAIPPHEVFGTWKAAVKIGTEVVTEADPPKNNWNLGAGSDVPQGGFALLQNEGYGTEVRWNVNDLRLNGQPLQAGHTYRLQVMVHDGDQNKVGGDAGQACVVVTIR